ncbi:MAG: plasmid mobilization protein [Lachnospira pectinoschiza]
MSNQHKHPTISFRISDAERKQIEARILASGMMKKDYFVRSCIYNRICVVGKKETIYPLVQTVNALYLQLLEMQKSFIECCEHQALNSLPTNDEIKELQTDYNNLLTAIIDLLDGAKYLWEGESHEQ